MESSDLLKEFVELAPKEWGAYRYEDRVALTRVNRACELGPLIDLADDRASAEAIIFLWDWLEGEGWKLSWQPNHNATIG